MKISADSSPASISWGKATPSSLSVLLIFLTVLAYWGIWNCDFVSYDDPISFTQNPQVKAGLGMAEIKWAFTTGCGANWHPLTWLSLMLDVSLFGTGPAGPHVTNLLLHCANSVLLFWGLRQLTHTKWRSFWVAALFALHPVHVESVAWISERKDVLSAFFFFLVLICYGRYVNSLKGSVSRLNRWYGLMLVFFAFGLMSKSMLVTLPFVLLLLDYWPMARFDGGGKKSTAISLFLEKIPFVLLSIILSIVTFMVQKNGGAMAKLSQFPLLSRVENSVVAYVRYLEKILTGLKLAVPYPLQPHLDISLVMVSLILLLGVTASVLYWTRRYPFLFTSWFWFGGMLVPVIGLVQVGQQALADRYTYLPAIGIFILIVWGAASWAEPRQWGNRTALKVAGGLLLAIMTYRTNQQAAFWRNDGTLFRHALAVTKDNYVAHLNYGDWLEAHGDKAGALEHFRQAFELGPLDCTVVYDIGNGYARSGRWREAINCYRVALKDKPDQPDILNNLGFALAATKQWDEAVTNFEHALKLKPDFGDAHNNLASVLFRQGDYKAAAEHFYEAAKQMSTNAQVEVNLGDTLLKLGQTDNAVTSFRKALELDPNNARAQAKLKALTAPATK